MASPSPSGLFRRNREALTLGAGIALLVLAWCGSMATLSAADRSKPDDWEKASLLYLPSGKLLKPMVLDFDEAVAGLIWVRGLQYFADEYLDNLGYEWMGQILDMVTILNPRFLPAYEFGGAILAKRRSEWPKIRSVLERGAKQFPEKWELSVYLAMGHLSLDSNYSAAAEALQPVAVLPGVPDHIRTLSATWLKKDGGEAMALAFLLDRYLHAPDAINREVFLERMLRLYPDAGRGVDKEIARKLLGLALADPRSEELVLGVLSEYLRGSVSPNSRRILDLVRR